MIHKEIMACTFKDIQGAFDKMFDTIKPAVTDKDVDEVTVNFIGSMLISPITTATLNINLATIKATKEYPQQKNLSPGSR